MATATFFEEEVCRLRTAQIIHQDKSPARPFEQLVKSNVQALP